MHPNLSGLPWLETWSTTQQGVAAARADKPLENVVDTSWHWAHESSPLVLVHNPAPSIPRGRGGEGERCARPTRTIPPGPAIHLGPRDGSSSPAKGKTRRFFTTHLGQFGVLDD